MAPSARGGKESEETSSVQRQAEKRIPRREIALSKERLQKSE
jgi:hypothetical protein